MSSSMVCDYSNKWTITGLDEFKDFAATPTFSPIEKDALAFCFESYYQYIIHPDLHSSDLTLFRLRFVKQHDSVISETLKMKLDVDVNYSDGSLFKKYETMIIDNIESMRQEYFMDVISENHKVSSTGGLIRSDHRNKMESNCLVIKCNLKIWDDSMKCTLLNQTELTMLNNLKLFVKDFISIYEPGVLSDIEFVVGEKSLPAHKAILTAHSPVFLKMLTNELKEYQTNQITITDATHEIFTSFLKYLYTCEINDQSWPHVRDLYVVADKYDVATLKNECRQIIPSLLSPDAVCEILLLAYKYDDSELKEKAVQYAVSHIKNILPKEEWKGMVQSYPHIGYDVTVKFVPDLTRISKDI